MALADHQYRYRGLTFGADTDFEAVTVEGLFGFDARVGDQPLPRGHGSVPGKHFAAARQMLVVAEVFDPVEVDMALLRKALAPSPDPDLVDDELVFKLPGLPELMVRCRPTQFAHRIDADATFRSTPRFGLIAADPRIYSSAAHVGVVPLFDASGGSLDYPITNYPKEWPAGVALDLAVTNAGEADAYPTVRFFGPTSSTVTEVKVTNRTTGQVLRITATISPGQILTFDGTAWVTGSGDQVVGLDGASRYGDWEQPREALKLPPGDSVLRFEKVGTGTDPRCEVTWRDTWIA